MTSSRFHRAMAAALPVLAFAILVGGASHWSARAANIVPPTVADCQSSWTSAPAAAYCTSPEITVSGVNCRVEDECSITATVTQADGTSASTTWTPSLDATSALSTVDDIDICFAKNSAGTAFTAAFKTTCAIGETDSDSATEDGLSLVTTGTDNTGRD